MEPTHYDTFGSKSELNNGSKSISRTPSKAMEIVHFRYGQNGHMGFKSQKKKNLHIQIQTKEGDIKKRLW